ncbi:tyrosine-type recombinase/integrase [Amycolatopsis thermoflava]|uniref:tyrosine-type recombinase/integrase n=1 Tax=Amycolatopsis thermoflava TaxID=84480 RepID=UPI0036554122
MINEGDRREPVPLSFLHRALTAFSRFSEAAKQWLDEYRKDAENGIYALTSVDTYSDHLRNHVLPRLGNLRLFEVKTPVINALCQAKLKAHSLSLAKHTKAVISNVMTFAVQAGAIERNPTREIAPLTERRAKTKKTKSRALSGDELVDFLAKLDADEEARKADLPDLVRGFIATGERRGEMLAADWPDFDEEERVLHVTGGLVQVRGKGTLRNDGKTENAVRPIPLPEWYVTMLIDRRERLGVPNPTGPIYPNSRGGYLNFQNLTNRHWLPFRRRAGYEWVTFKTLRKTVATLLDEAGLTARQIADLLGHAHPSMTMNVYMGRGQKSRATADALGALPLGKTGD